jgi:hypothetical protein
MYRTKSSPIKRSGIFMHGWDTQTESWHGPVPLDPKRRGNRVTSKVRASQGSFHGKLRSSVSGLPSIEFNTSVFYLRDTGLAIIHMEGPHGGPVGIVAVVPSERRKLLRDDMAFELMTLISFLGSPANAGCELQINDYIEQALREEPSATHVFAVETAELGWDASIVLSTLFENLASAIVDRMAAEEPEDEAVLEAGESGARPFIPGPCPPAAYPVVPFGAGLARQARGAS